MDSEYSDFHPLDETNMPNGVVDTPNGDKK